MPSRIFFIVVVLLGAMILVAPLPASAAQPAQRDIHIDASQFAYSPSEIHVRQGDKVTIELSSTDVVHGLYLDVYDISFTTDPGQTSELTFTADRPGLFRFRCNVTCGAMHPFMIGKLVVDNNNGLVRTTGLIVLAGLSTIFYPRKPRTA